MGRCWVRVGARLPGRSALMLSSRALALPTQFRSAAALAASSDDDDARQWMVVDVCPALSGHSDTARGLSPQWSVGNTRLDSMAVTWWIVHSMPEGVMQALPLDGRATGCLSCLTVTAS